MSKKMTLVIQKEEDWYVSKCLENNVASQGKTIEEAMKNLKEAIELYYEDEKPDFEENESRKKKHNQKVFKKRNWTINKKEIENRGDPYASI